MSLSRSIHQRLLHQHEAMHAIISGISKERMTYRPAPEKWNIHDNIVHLAKYQPVFIERLNTMLQENSPEFGRYRAEDDVEFETWRSWTTDKLFVKLQHHRQSIIEIVSPLDKDQLNRIGIHKKFGHLTIEKWLEFFLLHEAHHMFTIFQLANDLDIKV
ncbi:MAG TPA: DinB family protein [Bacteroidia bacterium]|jgi:hypothetical protein|nr:DinB family protein [Bacteroidia bacterium]